MMRACISLVGLILAISSPALAEPCGEIPQEGVCNGNTPQYCDSTGQLKAGTPCDGGCCGWNGKKFDCLACPPDRDCQADGCPCFAECNNPDVFGCNLQNTHQWTCEVDDTGCVRRVFVKCGDGEICNEEGNHQCTDIDNVDLCGGVPADGVCDGEVHKACVDKKIVQTDCAAQGLACLKSGCGDCPFECNLGESGCLLTGEQWTCTQNPVTGCNVKAAKHCGIKSCVDGECTFGDSAADGDDDGSGSDTTDAGQASDGDDVGSSDATDVGQSTAGLTSFDGTDESSSDSGGGCMVTASPEGFAEGTLVLLVTLLGFLLFTRIVEKNG